MLNRTEVLETLRRYFETKGRVLLSQEYARETDTPMRLQQVIAYFGSWKRLEKLLMVREEKTDTGTDVAEVIAARNTALAEAQTQWIEASENQDLKAQREAQAQAVAEVLARNAATPQGANANKLAIGGKLPHEQQDYSAMGATVQTNPKTGEQTIVDTDPDVPTSTVTDPRTPLELRDAAAAENSAKNGSVPVDKSTADGSTGQASTDTVSALTDDDSSTTKAPNSAKK